MDIPFPLPLPDTPRVTETHEYGGFTFTMKLAPELAGALVPLRHRLELLVENGRAANGDETIVGFNLFRLVQTGSQSFAVHTVDYRAEDIGRSSVDDLTFALWIEAAQWDVTSRAGVGELKTDWAEDIEIEEGARDAINASKPDNLLLIRKQAPQSEQQHSGWSIQLSETPGKRKDRRRKTLVTGVLIGPAPFLVPFLTLPPGTAVEFSRREFGAAWRDGTLPPQIVLDRQGNGAGGTAHFGATDELPQTAANTSVAPAPQSPMGAWPPGVPATEPIEVALEVDGLTLVARTAPELAGAARNLLQTFAQHGEDELRSDGMSIGFGFNIFWLRQTGESEYAVIAPDYSQPWDFASARTDDLTTALWVEATQVDVIRRTGVEPQQTYLSHVIAIQRSLENALESGEPVNIIAERRPMPDADRLVDNYVISGWSLSGGIPVNAEDDEMASVHAGALVAKFPGVVPFLQLPDDVVLGFVGNAFQGASMIDRDSLSPELDQERSSSPARLVAAGAGSALLAADGTVARES